MSSSSRLRCKGCITAETGATARSIYLTCQLLHKLFTCKASYGVGVEGEGGGHEEHAMCGEGE
ncbi:unnamed protein product [Coregonus sp. 'balchen']|nr:unnamed protein product [Coregonus sp. 'balchen']